MILFTDLIIKLNAYNTVKEDEIVGLIFITWYDMILLA